jgi:hypothetical protein
MWLARRWLAGWLLLLPVCGIVQAFVKKDKTAITLVPGGRTGSSLVFLRVWLSCGSDDASSTRGLIE